MQLLNLTYLSDFLFGRIHSPLLLGGKFALRTLRHRLIIAFISLSMVVLAIFGVMAHYIATEFGIESELHTLAGIAEEKAAALSQQLTGKTIQQVNTLVQQQNAYTVLPILILDAKKQVVSATPRAHKLDINHINDYFGDLQAGVNMGIMHLDSGMNMWTLAKVPETAYTLAIFHAEENDLTFVEALGNKLVVGAVLVICFTGWLALILASMISYRLDKQNAVLVHQSLYDQLTDLPNRKLLFDRLQQAIYQARRNNHTVALFLVELANLKEINDTLGHQSGDELLKQIGPRLENILRDSDTVARLEGGEFAILMPIIDIQHVTKVAHKIIQALEAPFIVDELELETSVIAGVAIAPDHGEKSESLFRKADVAMSLAKQHEHEFNIYAEESDPHSVEQLTLMAELRRAITNNELQLYYQPKINLKTQQVTGAEALLRWFHPQRGLIPPDDFIPKAEQSGLIKLLTSWVIDQAFRQNHAWSKLGITLQIAINVSQRSLYDRELINQIANTMQKLQIKNCTLDIEITETAIMAYPEQSMATLQMLHAMGIHLSIDDFGTGFTSLAYLKELPVDELKIDKSFIMRMLDDNKDTMIVRSIIELAHSLGRVVVAEGVESRPVLDYLTALNCDTAQGFYMSKPLPAAEFEQWLATCEWKPAIGQADTG